MQICHIASHKGNVGDLINHQGFYNNMLPAEASANIERIELRDFYYSYNQRRVFDEHLDRQMLFLDRIRLIIVEYIEVECVKRNEKLFLVKKSFS